MIVETVNIKMDTVDLREAILQKDIWLVVLHANRVPPHIGLMINGNYNSLTIKGHEINVSSEALLKIISQKKIESIFIKLKKNPVFSYDHQLEMLQEMISKFENVRQYEATCLSPLKLFFEHFYAVTNIEEELYFDLMKRMNENEYFEFASASNFDLHNGFLELPYYTVEQLHQTIKEQRLPYYKD
ncbi:MAG: hypothetical protein JNJ40_07305 [Bacteroidia bacterium]|nr:hypothetical protein [Bacteroidia bacterium]